MALWIPACAGMAWLYAPLRLSFAGPSLNLSLRGGGVWGAAQKGPEGQSGFPPARE